MNKAIITIKQDNKDFELGMKPLVNDKERFIACEAHVLATIVVRHLQQGTFSHELALAMKNLDTHEDQYEHRRKNIS